MRSARYAGPDATYEENVDRLLADRDNYFEEHDDSYRRAIVTDVYADAEDLFAYRPDVKSARRIRDRSRPVSAATPNISSISSIGAPGVYALPNPMPSPP